PAHLKLSHETKLTLNDDRPQQINWSDTGFLAIDALEVRKEIYITELRGMVGEKNMNAVLQELLENEAVFIHDSLQPTYKPKKENIVSLAASYQNETALHELFESLKRAPKQESILLSYIELVAKSNIVKQQDLLE